MVGGAELEARATRLLHEMLGPDARFRDGQLEAVQGIVRVRGRVLVVQRTGWGKSLVYFLSTRLLRDEGAGPTLLVSPLLSLMRDQLAMAARIGIRAGTINSSNADEWSEVEAALTDDDVDVLLVSPERLANSRFLDQTVPRMQRGIGLFVVDEAHCISDWGHDFRPDYRRIRRIVSQLPRSVPVLATTATANDRVVADVVAQLGPDLVTIRGPLMRESLRMQVIQLDDQAERLAWLVANLARLPGSGIIYCLTVADCERVSAWLIDQGFSVAAYHGRLENDTRQELEDALRHNRVKALVATVALGMGFDKPDLGFVVHFQQPGSAVAYYQQIGRAGRALADALVILLAGAEDDDIQRYFIESAFPTEDEAAEVVSALEASDDGLTLPELEHRINRPRARLVQALKVLTIDGAAYMDGSRYHRSANPWAQDTERTSAVTQQRWDELERMRAIVRGDACLMESLAVELDDPHATACGRCAVCSGPFISSNVASDLVQRASIFLKRSYRPIPPRVRGVAGIEGWSGMLPQRRRCELGMALSIYGDAGWGHTVALGKYRDGRFSEELVEAAATMVETAWRPAPSPTWLTAVPSRRTEMVPEFARRLAARLRLPYRPALRKIQDNPPQKDMANSPQQARNVVGAFIVDGDDVDPGPVLLVDDMVDSRWTITVCAALLRDAGAGPVFPLALADSSQGNGAP